MTKVFTQAYFETKNFTNQKNPQNPFEIQAFGTYFQSQTVGIFFSIGAIIRTRRDGT